MSVSLTEQAVRNRIALELARCHRLHLDAELAKPAELLAAVTAEGIPFEEHTRQIRADLLREFPEAAADFDPPGRSGPSNLMRTWYEKIARPRGGPRYEQSTFKMMNVVFWHRILHARDGSDEERDRMVRACSHNMRISRIVDRGFAFRQLIRAEVFMRAQVVEYLERIGLAEIAIVRRVADDLQTAVLDAWFTYYYELAMEERNRSEVLLRNILPVSVADELRRNGRTTPVHYDSATVVFTDFVGFTSQAAVMSPIHLVDHLDRHFRAFDQIIAAHGLEKLKTIGDAYMFAGGIPAASKDHAENCVRAALVIRDYMLTQDTGSAWPIRIGVHTGPLVAGIVGENKFSYDVWGDTVNVASRLETAGEAGQVNISDETYRLVRGQFDCTDRGSIAVKNRGEMRMWFVQGEL